MPQSSNNYKTLSVDLNDNSYDINIGEGLLSSIEILVPFSVKGRKIFILTDENVKKLYSEQVVSSFEALGADVFLICVAGGESSKSFKDFEDISNQMLENKVTRDSVLVALGGGVVGDLGGFVASTIVRGISYIQIPTTLLSQVDSSVGGKTAINTKFGKNLVGTFYQPKSVIIDLDVLKTLSDREYKAGLAEVIKYGFIYDAEFYQYLIDNLDNLNSRDMSVCKEIVLKSCAIKAKIVAEDEKELSGKRALLNFGHTFGHALELMAGYNGDVLHGEAVSVGMIMALQASHDIGNNISPSDIDNAILTLKSLNLPVSCSDLGLNNVDVGEMYDLMLGDKKASKDGIGFILLNRIDDAVINKDLSKDFIKQLIEKFI